MKASILFLSLCLSLPAQARLFGSVEQANDGRAAITKEECSGIDLLEKRRPNDRWQRPFLQTGTQWCGAYSAADAFSYNSRLPISPMYLGALFAQKNSANAKPPTTFDPNLGRGPSVCEAIETIFTSGFCDYEYLEGKGITTEDVTSLIELYEKTRSFFDQNPGRAISRGQVLTRLLSEDRSHSPEQKAWYLKLLSSEKIPGDLPNATEFFATFLTLQCDQPKKIRILPSCSYFVKRDENNFLGGTIDRELSKGVMPVLTFNAKHIYANPNVDNFAPHAVTINARRWNEERNRCEYRIKNSGPLTACYLYLSNVTCTEEEVANGYVWLEASVFEADPWTNIAIVGAERHRMRIKLPSEANPQVGKAEGK